MNLLYIGPYRQYDYMGQTSRILLHSIKEKCSYNNHKVYSRPLYIDFGSVDEKMPEYIKKDETFPSDSTNWSGIIQHMPVEFLSSQSFTKNIAIPILNNQLAKTSLNNNNFRKLNLFDHVLVENDNQKNFLLKSGITTKISVYNEEIKTDYIDHNLRNKQFDLGSLNNNFVFAFIGSYSSNQNIIHKLIVSFLVAFRSEPKNTLFFLLKGTSEDKEELMKFYNETKQKLNILDINPVIFSFGSLQLQESIACINTCSCYLSINDDVAYNMYEKYAQSINKPIISKYNLEVTHTPGLGVGYFYDIEDVIGSINTMSLTYKLKSIQSDNKILKNKSNNKSVGEIICNILQ